jgi:hypothetical protein
MYERCPGMSLRYPTTSSNLDQWQPGTKRWSKNGVWKLTSTAFQSVPHSLVCFPLQTALCHVSEVSDKFLKDLSQEYEAGDRVRAVVKKVDLEKQRVSIVMKKSALQEAHAIKAGRGKLENGTSNGDDDVIENGNGSGGESDGEEDVGAAAEELEAGTDEEEAGAAEDGSESGEEAAGSHEEESDEEEVRGWPLLILK